jgi:hypothetical protein
MNINTDWLSDTAENLVDQAKDASSLLSRASAAASELVPDMFPILSPTMQSLGTVRANIGSVRANMGSVVSSMARISSAEAAAAEAGAVVAPSPFADAAGGGAPMPNGELNMGKFTLLAPPPLHARGTSLDGETCFGETLGGTLSGALGSAPAATLQVNSCTPPSSAKVLMATLDDDESGGDESGGGSGAGQHGSDVSPRAVAKRRGPFRRSASFGEGIPARLSEVTGLEGLGKAIEDRFDAIHSYLHVKAGGGCTGAT